MGKQSAAGRTCIQIGPPVRGPLQILFHAPSRRIEPVHFSSQAFEFGYRHVTGAALCGSFLNKISGSIKLGGRKRFAAFSCQRSVKNIGGGVQVALGMAANQFLIPGEDYVAFNDACSHDGAASYACLVCSGNCRPAPRWPMEKSDLWNSRLAQCLSLLLRGRVPCRSRGRRDVGRLETFPALSKLVVAAVMVAVIIPSACGRGRYKPG